MPDREVFYFSVADFPGLSCLPYEITSSLGHKLAGRFYSYDGADESRIVILEHGMGPGHISYMREIEVLAAHGYLVFTYDHTGTLDSGGENIGGFVQSLRDLDDVISALRRDEKYKERKISVVGHSWGGFSALNIASRHSDISHVVAIAPFISVKRIIEQYFGLFPFGVAERIYLDECEKNREYIGTNAVDVLKTSPIKTMVIHSKGDEKVSFDMHFELLRREIGEKDGIVFLEVSDRNHNPTLTRDAIEYKMRYNRERKAARRRGKLSTVDERDRFRCSYDWRRMTEQDTEIWEKIFSFLDETENKK